jgi:predicted transcriptional regulator
MPLIADDNRELWLWLFRDGRALTAREVAREMGREPEKVFWQLNQMSQKRRSLVEIMPAREGDRRFRYAVTGTCRVPVGMHVAEVQA